MSNRSIAIVVAAGVGLGAAVGRALQTQERTNRRPGADVRQTEAVIDLRTEKVVKASYISGQFFLPEDPGYDAVAADIRYESAEAAAADGFTRAPAFSVH